MIDKKSYWCDKTLRISKDKNKDEGKNGIIGMFANIKNISVKAEVAEQGNIEILIEIK